MSPKQVHSHLLGSFQSGLFESGSQDFSMQINEQLGSSQSGVCSVNSPCCAAAPKQVHSHLLGSFQLGLLESGSHDF